MFVRYKLPGLCKDAFAGHEGKLLVYYFVERRMNFGIKCTVSKKDD
jgi:hypothetical protein